MKSANTSRLFLPKCIGGLQLPSISTTFSRSVLQCAKAASLISSRETTQKTLAELKVRPSNHINRWSRHWWRILDLVARVKKMVVQKDTSACLEHCMLRPYSAGTDHEAIQWLCMLPLKRVYLCISPAQWGGTIIKLESKYKNHMQDKHRWPLIYCFPQTITMHNRQQARIGDLEWPYHPRTSLTHGSFWDRIEATVDRKRVEYTKIYWPVCCQLSYIPVHSGPWRWVQEDSSTQSVWPALLQPSDPFWAEGAESFGGRLSDHVFTGLRHLVPTKLAKVTFPFTLLPNLHVDSKTLFMLLKHYIYVHQHALASPSCVSIFLS